MEYNRYLDTKILRYKVVKSKLEINLSKNKNKKGIWQFSSYLAPIETPFQLSLGEGDTKEIQFDDYLILKREDLNPTGSLKDRGMAYLVSRAFQEGRNRLVLSSSGNAAISAAAYCKLAGIKLIVFLSTKINKNKLSKIKESGAEVILTLRPVSEAIKFARRNNCINLRPSQNLFGSEGYQTIAFELAENQGLVEDVFIPVSSGAAMIGIAMGFKKLGFTPRFHICQPSAICPIASLFDKNYDSEEENLADSIVGRYTPLRKQIISLTKESQGTGWVIGNEQVRLAQKILQEKGIETSHEGALALAAVLKAREKGVKLGKTACLLTGKKY